MIRSFTGFRGCWMLCIATFATCCSLSAQTKADFSASTLAGCSPIIVHFTDLSTGNPTQWRWDLGNGVTSSLQNPITTYFNAGTYTVKLVVRSASGSDSVVKSQLISVYANPIVKFSAPDTAGCLPLKVQFQDLSSTESGSITSWNWDFGDGTTSSERNPSHTYISSGQFNVTLKVTNSFGCTKALSKSPYIVVSRGAVSGFTNDNPGLCTPPVTIKFTNTSSGTGTLSYLWDFGDGSTSTLTNPVHTYTTRGSYTVTLITRTPQGCRDTLKKVNLVSIGNITSNFTVPQNICAGTAFSPVNTTSPSPGSVTWHFGDGSRSTDAKPVKVYTTPGTYSIKLVNDLGGCRDSITKVVRVVAKPVAAFSADKTTACRFPVTITFTNKTAAKSTLLWDFGDGTTSTQENPSHTYTTEGRFTVRLIATNESGCPDTLIMNEYIQVEKPRITIANLPATGCAPLTVTPVPTVIANQPIVSYRWDFGDGASSTAATPTHTYATAGTYTVKLTVATAEGCTETLSIDSAVRAGIKPEAKFSVSPKEACAFQRVDFQDLSTGNVDEWLWSFGDGSTSRRKNPSYTYKDTAQYTVTLIAYNNTCPDTVRIENAVHSNPPIAMFSINRSCSARYTKDFVDKTVNASSYYWDFGDGTSSTLKNPSHTYSKPGNYLVVLTVTNGNCSHSRREETPVVDERADFTVPDTVACKGSPVLFTATRANAARVNKWSWDFGDGSTSTAASSVAHTYKTPGVHTVSLRITDILGCTDMKTMRITVYGPTAGFSNIRAACLFQNSILFTDTSKTDGLHPVINTFWNYGDGTTGGGQPPYRHTYTKAGVYPVTLAVTDSYGCSDTLTKTDAVIIAQPLAAFTSPDTNSCIGKSIRFTNLSEGTRLQSTWDFGDATSQIATNPVHPYARIGLYTVKLKVQDTYGCSDSTTRSGYIRISLPKASFTVSDSISMCPPLMVNFTHAAVNYVSLSWDFGDGNTSTLEKPSHYYTIAGVYYSKLIATGPGGCTDTMIKKIVVKGPKGSFTYSPETGCDSARVSFQATTQARDSIVWDLGDGTTLFNNDSLIRHTYFPGEYLPKMILIDASGCKVPVVGATRIKVVNTRAEFTTDMNRLCDSGSISFRNTSTSNDLITDYFWRFGDSNSSNSRNPSHQYTKPGSYTTTLKIITQAGCTDSMVMRESVRVFESPVIRVQNDSAACVPADLRFTASVLRGDPASLKWHWDFGNGQTSSVQSPAPQSYSSDGSYTVLTSATDANSCAAESAKTINIHPLPNTSAGGDLGICAGSSIQLRPSGADRYIWNPSPALSCSDCESPVAKPTDTTDFVVTGTTNFGCTRSDTIRVAIAHPFELSVSPDSKVCAGGSTLLSARGGYTYNWSPSAGLAEPSAAATNAKPAATTVYTVTAKDSAGCFTRTADVRVTVIPLPTIVADDITIAAGSSAQIRVQGSPGITYYRWTPASQLSCFDCAEPQASPKKTTQYEVEVRNGDGCVNKDALTVFVTCSNGNLFIPNTFSPNGDGMNDRFYPRGKGIGLVQSLRVFNRWGEIVFDQRNFNANDASAGWDGSYRGRNLGTDVFVYICEIVCDNSEILRFTGDITLIK